MAYLILRGHVNVVRDQEGIRFSCSQRHVGGAQIVLNKTDYDALTKAADTLKYAIGFIAKVEDEKFASVIGHIQGR